MSHDHEIMLKSVTKNCNVISQSDQLHMHRFLFHLLCTFWCISNVLQFENETKKTWEIAHILRFIHFCSQKIKIIETWLMDFPFKFCIYFQFHFFHFSFSISNAKKSIISSPGRLVVSRGFAPDSLKSVRSIVVQSDVFSVWLIFFIIFFVFINFPCNLCCHSTQIQFYI